MCSHKKENKEMQKLMLIFVILSVGIIIVLSGITYAFFATEKKQSGVSSLKSSCFNVAFTDANSINLEKAYSMDDNKSQTMEPYTFTITNTCDIEAAYFVLLNTKTGSFSSEHINYSLNKGNASKLSSKTENTENIPSGYNKSYILQKGTLIKGESATYDLRLWLNAETTYEDVRGMSWEGEVRVVSSVAELEPPSLLSYYNKVEKKTTIPEFGKNATTDETADGLYGMVDDSGEMSYYYRGLVTNNYVKFGQDKQGNDMYWRIIRFNGDGTMRMQYDGTQAWANNTSNTNRVAIINQVWNTTSNDNRYVGYMFGDSSGTKEEAQSNANPSEIKTGLENWYEDNIYKTGYHDYIADEIFCNDRSTPGSTVSDWSMDTGRGYGTQTTGFGGLSRFMTGSEANRATIVARESPTPQFTCPQNNDKFTVSNEFGNGVLEYPVGLITADEIIAAEGGIWNKNNPYRSYLYKGTGYWSITPCYHLYGGNTMFRENSGLFSLNPSTATGVAPVINIKTEYLNQFVGDGTIDSPWHLN